MDGIMGNALIRAVDLSHVMLGAYFVKRVFDYLTSRLSVHGAEPVVVERRPDDDAKVVGVPSRYGNNVMMADPLAAENAKIRQSALFDAG